MQVKGFKIDLGIVQDGQSIAKELLDSAAELKGNKDDIKVTVRRIEGLTTDGIALFKSLQNAIARIDSVNKQLGIETKIPQLAEMEKALTAWSNANSQKI